MKRCLGFVSSVMMMMMIMGHDETIILYLPYMICTYVHVHEKRNDLECKVHYRINMEVKIFKRHRTFLYLGIPTYIQLFRLLPTKEIEPNHSFILSPNFDQVSMFPSFHKVHF